MKITIREIARRAGVSTATVSRIINGLGGYNDDTKEKVLAVIEETGYKGNASALKDYNHPKVDKLIGVLVPDLETDFTQKLFLVLKKLHVNKAIVY